MMKSKRDAVIPFRTLAILALAGGFAPFALDTYLPGLPSIADEFQASASLVQMTIAGYTVMMAMSQIVVGTLSDQIGRRKLMLIGLSGSAVASIVCGFSTSIWMLIVARLFQGALGSMGLVLARGMVVDMGRGVGVAKSIALLMSVQSLAPAIAPAMGGLLVPSFGWRSAFWFLSILNIITLVAVYFGLAETLPPERRISAGFRSARASMGRLLDKPAYRYGMFMVLFSFMTLFSYVSASSFILQNIVGLSARQFSIVFTTNALMLFVGGFVTSRAVSFMTPQNLVSKALFIFVGAVVWLVISVFLLDTAGWAIILGFFFLVMSQGVMNPMLAAITLEAAEDNVGTGAALMGAVQFGSASIVAPLTGLGGGLSAVPMVLVMVVSSALVLICYTLYVQKKVADPDVIQVSRT